MDYSPAMMKVRYREYLARQKVTEEEKYRAQMDSARAALGRGLEEKGIGWTLNKVLAEEFQDLGYKVTASDYFSDYFGATIGYHIEFPD